MNREQIGEGYFIVDNQTDDGQPRKELTDERIGYLLDPIKSQFAVEEIRNRYSMRRKKSARYTNGR